jgi:hypothetical protein
MGSKVQEQISGPPSDLEVAGHANDRFVATLGELAMRTLKEICEDKDEDGRARVTAAKTMLDWIRPPKAASINLNVAPAYHSHLNLPAPIEAPPKAIDVTTESVDRSVPKLLPEAKGHMAEARLTQYSEVTMSAAPAAPTLPAREQKPLVPSKPPAASTVRKF